MRRATLAPNERAGWICLWVTSCLAYISNTHTPTHTLTEYTPYFHTKPAYHNLINNKILIKISLFIYVIILMHIEFIVNVAS